MQADKTLMVSRFLKAASSYDNNAKAQQKIAFKMTELLQPHVKNKIKRAIEIGCGTGTFSRLLINAFRPAFMTLNDICPEMEDRCTDILAHANYSFAGCDAEQWELPRNCDLIASCSTFQWFKHPDIFFRKAHEALNNKGLLSFSTFGTENMKEISSLTGYSLSYISLHELSEILLKAGFSILKAEEEKIMLTFNAPKDVLMHMKQTGVNCLSLQKWTKKNLQQFTEQYIADFSVNNSVSLTYHPIYFVCRKKRNINFTKN